MGPYEELREKEIEQKNKRIKQTFQECVKYELCHGLIAQCAKCKYKWVIKKKESIPGICPKCKKNKVEVTWENNKWELLESVEYT